jgi:hypothetical protein
MFHHSIILGAIKCAINFKEYGLQLEFFEISNQIQFTFSMLFYIVSLNLDQLYVL